MKLEPLFNYRVELKDSVTVGSGPFGTRIIADTKSGTASGAKVNGTFVESGGDWILVDANGVGRLDVRATLKTDDGAFIYLQYFGVVEMNEKVMQVVGSGEGEMDFGETYFMTQPRFESGDPRYEWLNRTVAVGEGRFLPGAVEYRLFAVVND